MEYKRCVVNGVFDLFHIGHLRLLKRASEYFTEVIVALDSDAFVSRTKRVPIFSENDRLAIVKACKYVTDAIIVDESYSPYSDDTDKIDAFMNEYNIDAIFIAADDEIGILKWFSYLHKTGRTVIVPRTQDISTTHIIKLVNGEIIKDRKNIKEMVRDN